MTRDVLAKKHCVPCEGGMPPLSREAAERLLAELNHGWELSADAQSIKKTFRFKTDKAALAFVAKIGKLAIAQGHHPRLTWAYNRVTLAHSTHAIGGLSENDFILAAKIERRIRASAQ